MISFLVGNAALMPTLLEMSNYRRAKTGGNIYFFTVVTYRRRLLFHDETCRLFLRNAIIKTQRNYPFTINAWVLLPDHLHCVWTLPQNDNDFSTRWNLIKSGFSKSAKTLYNNAQWMTTSKQKHRETTLWQRRFWEHQIRDESDYNNHIDYIRYNPVKHGWVTNVKDWPYSTFHRYVRQGVYPQNWEIPISRLV